MHGDDDQIVPYADSAPLSAKLLRNSTLKTYKGFPNGMQTTEADTINADLLTSLSMESSPASSWSIWEQAGRERLQRDVSSARVHFPR
jgi:hypothetical protein